MNIILKKTRIIILIITIIITSFGIPEYIMIRIKNAEASNNYIKDISFTKNKDGLATLTFTVQTSFNITIGPEQNENHDSKHCAIAGTYDFGRIQDNTKAFDIAPIENSDYTLTCDRTWYFTAGQKYTTLMLAPTGGARINKTTKKICVLNNCPEYGNTDLITYLGRQPTSSDYIYDFGKSYNEYSEWPFGDTEKYYFTEYPSLTITYPENNAEIAGNFNITGTITEPSPYIYNQLMTTAYFYNPWKEGVPYELIGNFTTPLTATSTQEFTQAIIGLPISRPNEIVLINELQKLEGDIITETYREGSGTEYPWLIRIKTYPEEELPTPPFEPPEWNKYFDIYRPSPSTDGYYRIKTPTSTIEFIYNFPETYKVKIIQEGEVKLATSTFSEIDPDGNLRFEVENFDASTSTIKWVNATIYSPDNTEIINIAFPILGLEEGEFENIGFWNTLERFIGRMASNLFLPSQTTLDKFKINLLDRLKSKIPFSYFYDIKTAINNIEVEEATSIPDIEYTIGPYTFAYNPLDITATEITESEGWQTFYNIMKMACWLMFVLYIIGRIRDRTTNTAD